VLLHRLVLCIEDRPAREGLLECLLSSRLSFHITRFQKKVKRKRGFKIYDLRIRRNFDFFEFSDIVKTIYGGFA